MSENRQCAVCGRMLFTIEENHRSICDTCARQIAQKDQMMNGIDQDNRRIRSLGSSQIRETIPSHQFGNLNS